jgi:hypothetical protein
MLLHMVEIRRNISSIRIIMMMIIIISLLLFFLLLYVVFLCLLLLHFFMMTMIRFFFIVITFIMDIDIYIYILSTGEIGVVGGSSFLISHLMSKVLFLPFEGAKLLSHVVLLVI